MPTAEKMEHGLDEAAMAAMRDEPVVQALNRRFDELLMARQGHEARWSLLGQYLAPHRVKFLARDREEPSRRSKIMDNTPGRAMKIARAGLQAGMASAGRPWFEFGISDAQLSEDPEVLEWMQDLRDTIMQVYDRTNYYQELGQQLGDELAFMTSAKMQLESDDKVCRFQVFPIGSYVLGESDEGDVNQFGREFQMTVEQAAQRFGLEYLSDSVKEALKQGRFGDKVVIRHGIFRRNGMNPESFGTEGMAWEEAYWEYVGATGKHNNESVRQSSGSGTGEVLEVGGYEEFPVSVARWDKVSGDVWGTDSPGNETLPDNKELQRQRRAYSNALAKIINPPMNADSQLDSTPLSIMSGAINYGGMVQGKGAYTPVHEIRLSLNEVQEGMADLRNAIKEGFLVNLFLLISQDSKNQPETAEAIREKIQEKADVLGPVLERHSDDVFDKDIDRTAAIILRKSRPFWATGEPGALIGPPPQQLEGLEVEINYVSEIASALKATRVAPIERSLAFMASLFEVDPTIVDNYDLDEASRLHSEASSAPPSMIRSQEEVDGLREARAAQEAAMQQAEQAPMLAKAAKDMGETNVPQAQETAAAIGAGPE
jgi:hypothetical protein